MDSLLNGIIIAMIVFLFVYLVWLIANYIMRSMTLYSIAKRRGIRASGMAWVPLAYVWTLGGIADRHDAGCGIQRRWRTAMILLAVFTVIGIIAFYAYLFCTYIPALQELSKVSMQEANVGLIKVILQVYGIMIPFMLISSTLNVCALVCTYKLYESCKPRKALALLLISCLVPFAAPFCLIACRKWDNGIKATPQPQIENGSSDARNSEDQTGNI